MFNSTSAPKLDRLVGASIEAGRVYSWNGPVCPTCHRGYVGQHSCTPADIQRQIELLQQKLYEVKAAA